MKTPLCLLLVSLLATAALAGELGSDIQLTANAATPQSRPLIALTPGGVVALWQDGGGLKSGLMAGQTPIEDARVSTLLDHAPAAAALATLGAESLAVWADGAKIIAVRLDGRAVPIGDPFVAANAETSQVAVAAGDERYLVAWPGRFGEVWAVVLSRNGGVLLPPMPVTTQSTDTISSLHAASNGDGFAIAWTAERRVFATLLSASGVPRSFLPIQMTANGGPSDVASNGSDFFVVWARPNENGLGARIMEEGTVSEEISLTRDADNIPRIAWDGSTYAVAFARRIQRNATTIFFTLVQSFGANGFLVDSTSTVFEGEPVLTTGGGKVAIAYAANGRIVVRFADAARPLVRRRAVR